MPRNAAERSMLGCFPAAAGRRRALPAPAVGIGVYEEGSTSAASTSVGTESPPPSSASTSSPAFLDDVDPPMYLHDDDGGGEVEADAGGLSTAIASRRLFLDSPGRSNSIVDYSVEHPATAAAVVPRGGSNNGAGAGASSSSTSARPVLVSTTTSRAEFLKSMREMVDAMGIDVARRGGGDRARLHELLLCYIALNDRDALPDILGAFTDLLFALNAHGHPAAAAADGGGGGVIQERGGAAKKREA